MTTSVTGKDQAFGYSITINVTYGVVSSVHRDPPVAELLLALAPTGAGPTPSRPGWCYCRPPPTPSPSVLRWGTAVVGVAHRFTGWLSCVLAPLLAGVGYILVQSVEIAAGWRRTLERDARPGTEPHGS